LGSFVTSASPSNRAETNFVKQIENQAAVSLDPPIPMTTTCGPTFVYATTTEKSKIVTKLPKGHPVERLKKYSRLAWLGDRVLGIGAGLFASAPEPSKQKKAASPKQPASQAPEKLEEQLWYFVRYSPKDERGWILGACATETPPKTRGGSSRE
jgi:hypothetical protein